MKSRRLDRQLGELTGDLANYTLGLFAATAALVLVTGCLAYLGWKQAGDMKASIAIADKSANAALKASNVAESALKDIERAFIYCKSPRLEMPPNSPYTARTAAF